MNSKSKYKWSKLNTQQLGKYAEYYVKMELILNGFEIYTTEVDDRGIDFVIKLDTNYFDIQVKSIRNYKYIFFPKDKFVLRDNLYAAVVIYVDNKIPEMYLIPSNVWIKPDTLFKSYDYKNKKSKPEWGLNINKSNISQLKEYSFNKTVDVLRKV